MPRLNTKRRGPAAGRLRAPVAPAALATLLFACFGLAACGGSSPSTSTSTPTVANAAVTGGVTQPPPRSTGTPGLTNPTGATGPTGPTGPSAGFRSPRFTAMRECLQKNGITLPPRSAGSPGGGLPGGQSGPTLPKGVTRAQYQKALEQCGANFPRRGRVPGGRVSTSPVFRTALASFAACMRSNGANVPNPNTSGKGPVFDTKGIDTSSPQFRKAEVQCRSTLLASLRAKVRSRAAGSGAGTAGSGAAGAGAGGSAAGSANGSAGG